MNPITLQEMAYTHSLLLRIKKPSAKLKAAIAKLENDICEHIDGIWTTKRFEERARSR